MGPDGKVIDRPEVYISHFADFSDLVNKLKIPHTFGAVTDHLQKSAAEIEAIVNDQNPGLTPALEKVDVTELNEDQIRDGALSNLFRRSGLIEDHTISLELQLPKEDIPSPNSKSESYHFASSAVASSNEPGSLHVEWGSNKRDGLSAPVVDSGSKDYVLKPQKDQLHVIFDKLYANNDNSGKPFDNSAVHSSVSNRFITEEFESPNKGDNDQVNVKGSHFSSQSSHSYSYQGGYIHS